MISLQITDPQTAAYLSHINTEVERAEKKHPEWPTDLVYMDQIINEEKGEVSRAINQHVMEGGSIEAVREELIQTAATCIRMLKEIGKEGSNG